MALHLCWLACAMYARDAARVFDIARWFPTHYQFHNEPIRLIASVANGLGFYGVDAFVSATNTKQYQRRMRTQEAIASGKPAKVNPRTGRWTTVGADDDEDGGADDMALDPDDRVAENATVQPLPTRPSPISEMFYGYLMLCASSYQPAMGTFADSPRLPAACAGFASYRPAAVPLVQCSVS